MDLVLSKNVDSICGEFAGVRLGDYRLERRMELIVGRMSQRPEPRERVWVHFQVAQHIPRVFLEHFSFCVGLASSRSERIPLGVIEVNEIARTGGKKPRRNRKVPLSVENESYRWFSQIVQVEQACRLPGKLIHVADREAESYELFHDCIRNRYRFVFRLSEDRKLSDGESKLFERLKTVEPLFERQVQLGNRKSERSKKDKKRHPARQKRSAIVRVAAQTFTVMKSGGLGNFVPTALTLNFIRAWETNPPTGEDPVQWILATTEPIDTAEEIS